MQERARKTANSGKSKLLPQMNRCQIAADDKVELHGAEAVSSRVLQRMGAHRSCHSSTGCVGRCHVAAVAYMGAATFLIDLKIVCAESLTVFLRNKDDVIWGEPVPKRLLSIHLPRQRV